MTFVSFDYIGNENLKTSERDLERQGRPSRGTPTPPGYGYLTHHLPQKVTHARISDSATEQVLMLETRGKEAQLYTQIPKCLGLSSHREQTHMLRVTMLPRLRCRQRPRRFSRPAADVLVLEAVTSCPQANTITFPYERDPSSIPAGMNYLHTRGAARHGTPSGSRATTTPATITTSASGGKTAAMIASRQTLL
jgi:hypothetical protein